MRDGRTRKFEHEGEGSNPAGDLCICSGDSVQPYLQTPSTDIMHVCMAGSWLEDVAESVMQMIQGRVKQD